MSRGPERTPLLRPGRATAYEVVELERIPWSLLGPEFSRIWGRPRGKNEPEHLEVLGPTGSGKSYFIARALKDRVAIRATGVIVICTKPADATMRALGWPIAKDWRGVQRNEQVIFWPRTSATGARRRAYQEAKIRDLLEKLWVPESNNLIVFDEVAYAEGLSKELRDLIQMYYREGRSQGIAVVSGKQRPQGTNRDMHSETAWKVAFKPADRADAERVAELFGQKRAWVDVLMDLDNEKREFVIMHKLTGTAYISWIDTELPTPKNTGRSQ